MIQNPIKKMLLSGLLPHPKNPRRISEDKLAILRKSLEEFGDTNILTWNKRTGHLLGGHQRLKIMQTLGIEDADVRIVDLPENKEKALMLRLNVADGKWDFPALKDIITEIDLGDLDIELTGFTQDEMESVFNIFSIPNNNKEIDEKKLSETNIECPNCGFKW